MGARKCGKQHETRQRESAEPRSRLAAPPPALDRAGGMLLQWAFSTDSLERYGILGRDALYPTRWLTAHCLRCSCLGLFHLWQISRSLQEATPLAIHRGCRYVCRWILGAGHHAGYLGSLCAFSTGPMRVGRHFLCWARSLCPRSFVVLAILGEKWKSALTRRCTRTREKHRTLVYCP